MGLLVVVLAACGGEEPKPLPPITVRVRIPSDSPHTLSLAADHGEPVDSPTCVDREGLALGWGFASWDEARHSNFRLIAQWKGADIVFDEAPIELYGFPPMKDLPLGAGPDGAELTMGRFCSHEWCPYAESSHLTYCYPGGDKRPLLWEDFSP